MKVRDCGPALLLVPALTTTNTEFPLCARQAPLHCCRRRLEARHHPNQLSVERHRAEGLQDLRLALQGGHAITHLRRVRRLSPPVGQHMLMCMQLGSSAADTNGQVSGDRLRFWLAIIQHCVQHPRTRPRPCWCVLQRILREAVVLISSRRLPLQHRAKQGRAPLHGPALPRQETT